MCNQKYSFRRSSGQDDSKPSVESLDFVDGSIYLVLTREGVSWVSRNEQIARLQSRFFSKSTEQD